MTETEQIIEHITQQTRVLLQNHWGDIADFRNGEEAIKIGFSALVKYEGLKRMIETKISFGKRVTDSVIDWIDPDQMSLGFERVPPSMPVTAKRKPGRPRKNPLETILRSSPLPDPQPIEPDTNPEWNPPA